MFAGAVILVSVLLALTVSPWFLDLTGFVGAGVHPGALFQ